MPIGIFSVLLRLFLVNGIGYIASYGAIKINAYLIVFLNLVLIAFSLVLVWVKNEKLFVFSLSSLWGRKNVFALADIRRVYIADVILSKSSDTTIEIVLISGVKHVFSTDLIKFDRRRLERYLSLNDVVVEHTTF